MCPCRMALNHVRALSWHTLPRNAAVMSASFSALSCCRLRVCLRALGGHCSQKFAVFRKIVHGAVQDVRFTAAADALGTVARVR